MTNLKQAIRLYIAWSSNKDDSEDLNLDAAQNRETDNNLKRANETVDARVKEAYCWLLVPYIDKVTDMKTIQWDRIRISGGNDGIISKAAKKMLQNEAIIITWAPALLKMELDSVLWKDSEDIPIKKLWEYLCTYCDLPRLANENVLNDAIQTGVNSTEYFAVASRYDGVRYIDLKFNQFIGTVERFGYLVKVDAAKKQISEDEAKRQAEAAALAGGNAGTPSGAGDIDGVTAYPMPDPGIGISEVNNGAGREAPKHTHFYMSAQLDNTRIGRDVQKLVEEVISNLTSVDGAQVDVTLDVNPEFPDIFYPCG